MLKFNMAELPVTTHQQENIINLNTIHIQNAEAQEL
jgi:hypothetical protein